MRGKILLALAGFLGVAVHGATVHAEELAEAPGVRCDGTGCALSACATRRLIGDPNGQLGPIRLVPQVRDGQPFGFKVYALPPQGLLSLIGLRNGDWITAVNGQTLTSPESALGVWAELRTAELVTVAVERQDAPLTVKVRLDPRPPAAGECPPLAPSPPPPSAAAPASPPKTPRSLLKDVRCKANRCVLKRSFLESLLANPSVLAEGGRIVPVMADGHASGLKLLPRPGGVWSLLGFQSGDLVKTVNDFSLDSPEQALAAYSRLRSANQLRVQLLRNGKPLTLTFVIQSE